VKILREYLPDFLFALLSLWLMTFDPGVLFSRIPVADDLVQHATPLRRIEWLRYAEQVRVYEVDHWMGATDDRAYCFYSSTPMALRFLRHPNVYVYTKNVTSSEVPDRLDLCFAHEVGHHIDESLGWVSKTNRFHGEVIDSLILLNSLPPGRDYPWTSTAHWIAEYPGVNGNPLSVDWGGYMELYADLHRFDFLIQIPPPLRHWFAAFLYYSPDSVGR